MCGTSASRIAGPRTSISTGAIRRWASTRRWPIRSDRRSSRSPRANTPSVSFDWTPVVVNQGHECLVAQVYDPISDPVVAPFNPVQDRHIGQRNISVVELPAGQTMNFDFFSQNLALTNAATELELQKLEGAALATLASALGRDVWTAAGGGEVDVSRPETIPERPHPQSHALATGTFRETLQDLPRRVKPDVSWGCCSRASLPGNRVAMAARCLRVRLAFRRIFHEKAAANAISPGPWRHPAGRGSRSTSHRASTCGPHFGQRCLVSRRQVRPTCGGSSNTQLDRLPVA